MRNLAAVLFRLERADTRASIEDALTNLWDGLRGPQRLNLRRTFETWLARIKIPRLAPAKEDSVELEEIIANWHRVLKDSEDEGMLKGKRAAELRILLRQLEIRFGEVPPDLRQRVEEAAPEQLERWAERVVIVDSLDAVFAGSEPRQ
jgi:hypothetical protein